MNKNWSRKKKVLYLFAYLVVNALYKRYVAHTSGADFGKPHGLVGVFSPSIIIGIDVFFDITGVVAFIWLLVELVKGVASRLSRKKKGNPHHDENPA